VTATVKFDMQDSRLKQALRDAPMPLYEHLRETMFLAWHGHRQHWLRKKGPRFGRGGRGVKVHRVGMAGKRTNRSVHYYLPRAREAGSDQGAKKLLLQLQTAEIRSDSAVLKQHETGGRIRARRRRWMTLAVSARPGDYKQWREKYPQRAKRLKRVPGRRGTVMIFEEMGKRKKRVKLRFIQTKQVVNKPHGEVYQAWDELRGRRAREWKVFGSKLTLALQDAVEGRNGG